MGQTPLNTTKREYFASLDGFRGVLALMVAIHHSQWYSYMNYGSFINKGFVLIDLFFVFSGFLMFRLYSQNMETSAQAGRFIKRRFARLYPIHLFMLLVFTAFALARLLAHKMGLAETSPGEILPFEAGSAETIGTFISQLGLTHAMGLHDSLSFNWPSWTISVEFYTYFTFCALLLWGRPKAAWHFGLMAGLIGLIYWGLSQTASEMDITYDFGFWRCMGGFYTGVLGAWLYIKLKSGDRADALFKGARAHVLEIFTLAAYFLFTAFCLGKLQFFVAPFALLFVLVFAFDRGFISRFMARSVFAYLAKISYSVYMVHAFIAVIFNMFASAIFTRLWGEEWDHIGIWGDLYLIPYLVVVVCVSHLTWKFIEIPGGKLLRNLDLSGWKKNGTAKAVSDK